MDDIDVRDLVRTAGNDVPPQFRAAMRGRLDAALSGEQLVTIPPAASGPHRGRWLAVAAAVVVVGVAATMLAMSDDDRGTLTPVTTPATTATTAVPTTVPIVVPSSAVPTTVMPTTVAPTTTQEVVTEATHPLPDPSIPLLSVDATWPTASVSAPIVTTKFVRTPTSNNWALFLDDGWTEHTQSADGAPVRLTHHSFDGTVLWTVEAPGTLGTARQAAQPVTGPFGVLYLYYEGLQDQQVAAIPTTGARAGEVVASWTVAASCYETYCGPPMTATGIALADGTSIAPYVDPAGKPTTATFQQPARATSLDAAGPAMPADWVADDANGNMITSARTTVTLGAASWTFDALGVMVAGDYHYVNQRVLDDGSLLVWFTCNDAAGVNPPHRKQFLGRLMPDGTSAFVEIPTNVLEATGKDGRIYVTTYDDATETYTLAELVFPA